MKTFFKYVFIIIFSALFTLYMEFLFALPKFVNLDGFKEDIQQIVKEQADLTLDYNNLKIVTTPLLSAGIKADDISLKLPDGSEIFAADSFQGRISLPSLLLLTVKVSYAEVNSPKINLEIFNGEQFKVVRLVENILNSKNKEEEETQKNETQSLPFDPSIIRVKVSNFNINDYKLLVNDLKSGHSLTLQGEKLTAGYNNGETFKVKTNAELLSDKNVNVKANIDIDSFLPPPSKLDEDDDPAERIEIPFVNPVLVYRDYDLKSDINAKLKIRKKDNLIKMRGFLDVEDTTMNLSGLQLPNSYIKAVFNGDSVKTDTNIYIAQDQNFNIKGVLGIGHKPFMNVKIASQRIMFNDVIILAKAVLDTLHIKNDMAELKGKGYLMANADIKTDFKKLKSKGAIIVRDGSVSYKKISLVFKDINSNLIFENNTFEVKNSSANINGAIVKTQGRIDENSVVDISLYTEKLPLPGLYRAFAPADLKKNYVLNSGLLSLNARVSGEMKNANSALNLGINNLSLSDIKNTFNINNNAFRANFNSDFKTVRGLITNNDLRFIIPSTGSVVSNPDLTVKIDEENININPFGIKLNGASLVNVSGEISEYSKNPVISVKADGGLFASDLKQLLGKEAAPFVNSSGKIPFKMSFKGDDKKQSLICQLFANSQNYITPVDIQSMYGKPSVLQAKIDFKKNRIKIKDTGLYIKAFPDFNDDLENNMVNTKGVAVISGTLVNLDKPEPFINLLKISIPKQLNGRLCAFKNSSFKTDGNLLVFGKTSSPLMRGDFKIFDVSIPDLLLTLDNADINFRGKNLGFNLSQLLLNGSDFRISGNVDLNPSNVIKISNLDILSNLINLERVMMVSDAAMKFAPPASASSKASSSADIPVVIRSGRFDLKRVIAEPITALNTTGRIHLLNNNLRVSNLNTYVLGGSVRGNVLVNLLNTNVRARLRGNNFDVEKSLLVLANMKDALSGTLSFDTDISLDGAASNQAAQMKSLKGDVNFIIDDGQLGPFGKIENLILAENIRESEFFKTTIGGVINNLTSIQTSHFNQMIGHLEFNDGIVNINPITTSGDVMCLHIAGDMNLLTNEADMKLRGKLGSQLSNMLGPIAAVNPVNLVKVTPGLNVMAAQAFQFFCEQISEAEMNAIPDFDQKFNMLSTTKFQVVLKGNVEKPLSLIKSFKWLALSDEIENAQQFVSTLPDPSIVEDPANATYEQIMQAQQLQAELQAKEDAKLKNKLIRFFRSNKE